MTLPRSVVCFFCGHDYDMHGKEISRNIIHVNAKCKRCGLKYDFVTFAVDKKDLEGEPT